MARKTYRFKSATVDQSLVEDQVPGDPVATAQTPCILCVDYQIDEENLGDLQQFMESQKWEFVAEIEAPPSGTLPLVWIASNSGDAYNVVLDDSGGTPELVFTPASM